MIDLSRGGIKPFDHQQSGVEELVLLRNEARGRILPGCILLGDEMRLGKTRQVIDTAQVLFERGELDTVIVVTINQCRDTWFDPEMGELQKHHWPGLPFFVQQHHIRQKEWVLDYVAGQPFLRWVVTNYEYIRYKVRNFRGRWTGAYLDPLLRVGKKAMLVLDESSAVSNFQSLQSRACHEIRERCSRVILMNGTPYGENPEDVFGQAHMMDKQILGIGFVGQFRARYAIIGGYEVERWDPRLGKKVKTPVEVLGWRHVPKPGCCEVPLHIKNARVHQPGPGIEEIEQKMAPYVLRRLKIHCLDIPPKLPAVTLTATLTNETWKMYREMRDDTVAWLDSHRAASALQAGVAVMRLSQITSGFLGGVRDMDALCPECGGSGSVPDRRTGAGGAQPSSQQDAASLGLNLKPEKVCPACQGEGTSPLLSEPQELGSEKLDLLMDWVRKRLKEDQDMQMLTWCRFRPEMFRAARELSTLPGLTVRSIYGGQKKEERDLGLRFMHPDAPRDPGPGLLVGTLGTGSMGLTMTRAHEVVYLSNVYSLLKRQQADDRPHGPGQTQSISYHDIVAVGPNGQKTVDHIVLKELRTRHDLAEWTTSAWVEALTKE